jgi:PKD repeat protein
MSLTGYIMQPLSIARAGKYTVSLTVSNAAGSNRVVRSGYITVNALKLPVAAFSASPISGKAQLTVAFTDKSTGSPASYLWDFGDKSSPSTVRNPVHKYSKAGKYTVSLTVKNAKGSNSETKSGYITVK